MCLRVGSLGCPHGEGEGVVKCVHQVFFVSISELDEVFLDDLAYSFFGDIEFGADLF